MNDAEHFRLWEAEWKEWLKEKAAAEARVTGHQLYRKEGS